MDETATIDLKEPVTSIEGEELKNFDKVKDRFKSDGKGGKIPKTNEEIRDEAPALLKGELISFLIQNFAQAKTKEQTAAIKRFCTKMINRTRKGDSKWTVGDNDLKEMEELLTLISVEKLQDANNTLGEVQIILEDAKEEIRSKKVNNQKTT